MASYQEALDLLKEIRNLVIGKTWKEQSIIRLKILLSNKLEELKITLRSIPIDETFEEEKIALIFEESLELINEISLNIPKDDMPFEYFEVELFRLMYASSYASLYGRGGELRMVGSAHALTSLLLGINTLDVQQLIVDWDHPEFEKRSNLLHNYLSSLIFFFFNLCLKMDQIHLSHLEYWLTEGLKAFKQFYKITERFWNVPKTIELGKRLNKTEYYSPYSASLGMLSSAFNLMLRLQKRFLDPRVKIEGFEEIVKTKQDGSFLKFLEEILSKTEWYKSDLEMHVKKGYFSPNEEPLNDPRVKEAFNYVELNRALLTSYKAAYEIIENNNLDKLKDLKEISLPFFYKYLERFKPLFNEPNFASSFLAENIKDVLKELIVSAGLVALKTGDMSYIKQTEEEYTLFFNKETLMYYPDLNGLLNMIKTTVDLKYSRQSQLKEYATNLIKLAEYSKHSPNNAFSFTLLGNILSFELGKIGKEEFLKNIQERYKELEFAFSTKLKNEIEGYLQNISNLVNNTNAELTFVDRRVTSAVYYDPYSIFVPDTRSSILQRDNITIIYQPFNLSKDTIIEE